MNATLKMIEANQGGEKIASMELIILNSNIDQKEDWNALACIRYDRPKFACS